MEKKAVIYSRSASEEQAEISLDKQVDECKKFTKENGLMIKAIYRHTLPESQSPEHLSRILDVMIERNIGKLLISDWSRISRDMITVIEVVNRFKKYDRLIISLSGDLELPIIKYTR